MRYRIEEVGLDGSPAPDNVYRIFVKSCGVIGRDTVPISVQEWNRPSSGGDSYVSDVVKNSLFTKVMVNFLLPMPDVDDPDENDKAREEIENRVKKFALMKMAEAFKNYKKDLDRKFVQKGKTPNFYGGYAKLEHHWADFVAYKTSSKALERSNINKKNARKKNTIIRWGLKGTPVAFLSGMHWRQSFLLPGSLRSPQHGMNGREICFTAMGARWTNKGRQYITRDTKIIPYCPSTILEVQ